MSERSELVEIIHKPIDKVGDVFNPYVLANDIIDAIHNAGFSITPIDGDSVVVSQKFLAGVFNEGFNEGCKEHETQKGGNNHWPSSKFFAALSKEGAPAPADGDRVSVPREITPEIREAMAAVYDPAWAYSDAQGVAETWADQSYKAALAAHRKEGKG